MNAQKTFSTRADVVLRRSYNRPLNPQGTLFETWPQTVERCIQHQKSLWENAKSDNLTAAELDELEELREIMLDREGFLAGRTLWLGGTDIAKRCASSQFNCSGLQIQNVYDLVDNFWLLLQGCFVKGTLVTMGCGCFKPIEEVLEGEWVKCYNPHTGDFEQKPVLRVNVNPPNPLVKVTLENGESITCTEDHLFLTTDGWKMAKDIEGVSVIKYSGQATDFEKSVRGYNWVSYKYLTKIDVMDFSEDPIEIKSVESVLSSDEPLYDLTVDGHHNYCVGETSVVVHNCGVGFVPVVGILNGFVKEIPEIEFIRSTRTMKGGAEHNTETWLSDSKTWIIQIGDSAIAWAKAVGKLVAGKRPAKKLIIDLSQIRPAGERLKGYGWISSGDGNLKIALEGICKVMNRSAGRLLSVIDILDIVNWLGSVLSSRRSSELALLDYRNPQWKEFALAKKDYYKNGELQRAQSNNSLIFYEPPTKEQLTEIFQLMVDSGGSEPGIVNGAAALKRAPYFKTLNPCLTGDTLVVVKDRGLVPIELLAGKKELLLDGNGDIVRCNVAMTNEKGICGKIKLSNGLEIEATAYHKLVTASGELVPVNELKVGAVLKIASIEGMFGTINDPLTARYAAKIAATQDDILSVPLFVLQGTESTVLTYITSFYDHSQESLFTSGVNTKWKLVFVHASHSFMSQFYQLCRLLGLYGQLSTFENEDKIGVKLIIENPAHLLKYTNHCLYYSPNYSTSGEIVTVEEIDFNQTKEVPVYCATVPSTQSFALGSVMSGNCAEVLLGDHSFCVSGYTYLITKNHGIVPIAEKVGQEIQVWNGEEWSTVIPRITGDYRPLLRVMFSDGSQLECTPEHRFSIYHLFSNSFEEVSAEHLRQVISDHRSVKSHVILSEPFKIGQDGLETMDESLYIACYSLGYYSETSEWLPTLKAVSKYCVDGIKHFLSGVLDRWGSAFFINEDDDEGETDWDYHIECDGSADYLQLLFTKVGIRTTIDQRTYNYVYLIVERPYLSELFCKKWELHDNFDRWSMPDPNQYIVSIKPLDGLHTTYCFDEPNKHKAVFNNVLTYQCNLVETVAPRYNGRFNEMLHTVRILARANYRQTCVNLVDGVLQKTWHELNEYLHLCGVGITGIVGWEGHKNPEMLKQLKQVAKDSANSMADELDLPRPALVTVIKPSGCRPGHELVTTDQGIFTLDELVHSDLNQQWGYPQHEVQALQEEGVAKKITKTYRNGHTPIYTTYLSQGFTLESTADHAWCVLEGDQEVWVKTKDLKTGQRIKMNLDVYSKETPSVFAHLDGVDYPLTNNLAWLLGCIQHSFCSITNSGIKIGAVNSVVANKIVELLKLCSGLDSLDCTVKEFSTRSVVYCEYNARLEQILTAKHVVHKGQVPYVVRTSTREHIIAYFSGVIDSEHSGITFLRRKKYHKIGMFVDKHYNQLAQYGSNNPTDRVARHYQQTALSVGLVFEKTSFFLGLLGCSLIDSMIELYLNSMMCKQYYRPAGSFENWTISCDLSQLGVVSAPVQWVFDKKDFTYDVEVDDNHWFYAGGFKSHNTLAKVADCSEGIHRPIGKYIFNHVMLSKYDPLVNKLKNANYYIFDHPTDQTSVLARFPVCFENVEFTVKDGKEVNEEPALEQLERYKFWMDHYVDNNISCTIYYVPEEVPGIIDWLIKNWDSYVATAFMFRNDASKTAADYGYTYLPQEVVTEEVYKAYAKTLLPISLDQEDQDFAIDSGEECAGGACPMR